MKQMRIGAYGGTFDPIHNGHIEVARAVVRRFALDHMLIVPAHRPPHKSGQEISSGHHRYAMAVLGTLDEEGILVSTIELDAPDHPYTFETVERLRNQYGEGAHIFFVMGADSFEEITTWREPARLLASADLIVAARPGHQIDGSHVAAGIAPEIIDLRGGGTVPATQSEAGRHRVYLTDYVELDVSSKEVRRRVRDGHSISGLAPPCVVDYIHKYELYRR